ncbi:MAG: ribosomal protein S18-alanine N-acetyltransferase [candidate division Zixibacteria bacterium]|nr:ribosomal protein S18-alanine N-acetyltransferase [candidate division Zixibacteria bacterium]
MGKNKPIIRPMAEGDLEVVTAMEKDLFSDPWPLSAFLDDLASDYSHPFVVQLDNDVAGYAILWIGVDEGHLTNIAVDRKYQRKSIAKQLLSYILRFAAESGLAQVILEVRPSNTPAIFLYESFGFTRLGVRKRYYRNPVEDCLVMKKEITGSNLR